MTGAAWKTERLVARRPAAGDLDLYRELLLDDRVSAVLRPPPQAPFTAEEVADRHAGDMEHWERHGFGPCLLFDTRDGGFVGRGGLRWTVVAGEGVVELPWSVMPRRWGAGLATEAARAALEWASALGLAEVVAYMDIRNRASRRVAEKAGLRFDREVDHAGLPHVLYRARLRGGRGRV